MADKIVNGVHGASDYREYVAPSDPAVKENLERFMDRKLGFMAHWSPATQWGCCESWPLCDDAAAWSRRDAYWYDNPDGLRKDYFALNKTFDPAAFNPDEWAALASDCGFKYLLFTTKHHDGFCMYDSKYTNYKVTSPDCPASRRSHPDVVRALYDSFRAKGIGIVAYFSKPDWHCPWYWAPDCEKKIGASRNPTYDPAARPELWDKYVEFTHNQLMELVENYGRLEALWLDGGQVRPDNGQDARISELMERARRVQPWLLCADRTVGGPNENYITPEQSVPNDAILVPWESCVTVGSHFSYHYDDKYKSGRALTHMLCDIVAKGGNLALNITPMPNGRLPRPAVASVRELGEWLNKNGDAIYATRAVAPYRCGNVAYTKKGGRVFAIVLHDEGVSGELRAAIPWDGDECEAVRVDTGAAVECRRTGCALDVRLTVAPDEFATALELKRPQA